MMDQTTMHTPSSKFYIETSIWLRLTDREDPQRRRPTFAFMRWARKKFDLVISPIVQAEVMGTDDLGLRRGGRRKLGQYRHRTITGGNPDVLVREFVRQCMLSENHLADLYHIAYAIIARADCLVTWEARHMARNWVRERVTEHCVERGRRPLLIGTPIEVAKWHGILIE